MSSLHRCDQCGRTSDDPGHVNAWLRVDRLDGLVFKSFGGAMVDIVGDYCSAACVAASARAYDFFTRVQEPDEMPA